MVSSSSYPIRKTHAGIPILARALVLLGLVAQPALAADESLYTIQRSQSNTSEALIQDYLKAKDLFYNVERRLTEALAAFRDAPLGRAEIDQVIAQMALINVQFLLNINEPEAAAKDLDIALARLRNAQLSMLSSRPVELRGMYIDAGAIPHTQAGIEALLDRLHAANFNAIFPEVSRRGYTIYPSRYTDLDPELKDIPFDPLWELIRQSNKRDMQIFPWLWIYRVRSVGYGNPILSRVPSLTAMPADPEQWKSVEPRFLSPAHPDARELVYRRLQELSETYPVDGILMDYIRYDEEILEDSISMTQFRMEQLRKTGQFPPLEIEKGTKLFMDWQFWREEQVNKTVRMLKEKLRGFRRKPVPLGAAVFRSESYSRSTKMQHWRHWENNHWIDFVSPMLYTTDTADLNMWLDWETDFGKRKDMLFPVLGAHRFQSPADIFAQIGVLHERHAPGLAIFAQSHFKPETLPDLTAGSFRKKAIPPNKNLPEALHTLALDMWHWFRKIEVADNAPAKEALEELINGAVQAVSHFRAYQDKAYQPSQLKGPLQKLKEKATALQAEGKIKLPFRKEIENKADYGLHLIAIEEQNRSADSQFTASSLPPISILPETKALPTVEVPYTPQGAKIDGALTEPFWDQAALAKVQYWHNGAARAEVDTTVKLAYGNDRLYIAFINEEPAMHLLKAATAGHDNSNIFVSDDAIELILAPGQNRTGYYHFTVNASNARFDQFQKDVKWNGKWESMVQRGEKQWVIEMAIPFADLGFSSGKGLNLAGNFFRNRPQDDNPHYAWSATYGSYHTPARFGTIQLR